MLRWLALTFVLLMAGTWAIAQDSNTNSNYGTSSRSRFGKSSYNSTGSDGYSGSSRGPFSRRNSTNANQSTDKDAKSQRQKQLDERKKRSNQPGTQDASTDKKTATTRGKKPESKKASTTGGGEARGATTVEFKMKANPNTNILFLEQVAKVPTMNISVTNGETFATRVGFSNGRHSEFDRLEVSIRYDPQVLKPVGIDDSPIARFLVEPAIAKVDRRKGIVAYRAEFTDAESQKPETLVKVQWKAVAATPYSPLAFSTTPDYPTRVLRGDVNVLHQRDEENEPIEVSEKTGLLDASVAVSPDADSLADIEDSENSFAGMALARSISDGSAEGKVSLALRSSKNTVTPNEEFLVDIVYSNPKRTDIDKFDLRIRFDPKVLQVVDYDENNWITRGVNIFDGDYHEDLPFDYLNTDRVYNSSGLIVYQMGFATKAQIPGSGVVATIKFRATNPSPMTEIYFELNENESDQKTSVSFLGFNLIGIPGERASALRNAMVRIQ